MKVTAFFAVSQTAKLGNANGYINAQGDIARMRTPHVLTTDRSKAEAAAAAYIAKRKGNDARIGSVVCDKEWVGQ